MSRLRHTKRTLSWPAFLAALSELLRQRSDLWAVQRVNRPFAERLMLAVTQVNQCQYCSAFHTRAALQAGVPEADIENLMAGSLNELPSAELVGLAFAQHYAATGGNPDPASWQRLVDTYGLRTARDILAIVRVIMLANLWGNTLDALCERLAGHPQSASRLRDEVAVVGLPVGLALAPVVVLAMVLRGAMNMRQRQRT